MASLDSPYGIGLRGQGMVGMLQPDKALLVDRRALRAAGLGSSGEADGDQKKKGKSGLYGLS